MEIKGIKNDRPIKDKELENLLFQALPSNYIKKLLETEFKGESIDIKTYLITALTNLIVLDISFNMDEVITFKKMLISFTEYTEKKLKTDSKAIKERGENLEKAFKNLLSDTERTEIEGKIKALNYIDLSELAQKDSEHIYKNKNYNDLEPSQAYKLCYSSYLFLVKMAEIERQEIEMYKAFKYSNDSNRKKADKLLSDGISYILDHAKNIHEYRLNDNLITENDYSLSKNAHDTELTRFNYDNTHIREALLTWYNARKITYNDEFRFKGLLNDLNNIKERLESDSITDTEKELLNQREKDIKTEIERLNIVKVVIYSSDGKEEINDLYKPININPNKIKVFNGDNNTIIIEFKALNKTNDDNKKIYISFHSGEFIKYNEYVSTLLDRLLTKAYRERNKTIILKRAELESIFINKNKKNVIYETDNALKVLLDMTINASYIDNGKYNKPRIKLDGVKVIDNYSYDRTSQELRITLTNGVLLWVLSSYYKDESKLLENNVIPKYNNLIRMITDNRNITNNYLYEEIGEKIGTPTLEYIKNNSRDYNKYFLDPIKKACCFLNGIDFKCDMIPYKKFSKAELEKASIKITKKMASQRMPNHD